MTYSLNLQNLTCTSKKEKIYQAACRQDEKSEDYSG